MRDICKLHSQLHFDIRKTTYETPFTCSCKSKHDKFVGCGAEDFVPLLMPTIRRSPEPLRPTLLAAVARQRAHSSPTVLSNIQPFRRQVKQRRRVNHYLQPQAPAASAAQAAVPASGPGASPQTPGVTAQQTTRPLSQQQQQKRGHSSVSQLQLQKTSGAAPMELALTAGRLLAAVGALASAAAVLVPRARGCYVPFGLEVNLSPPRANGHSRHAAIVAGMTRSLLCPTGDNLLAAGFNIDLQSRLMHPHLL